MRCGSAQRHRGGYHSQEKTTMINIYHTILEMYVRMYSAYDTSHALLVGETKEQNTRTQNEEVGFVMYLIQVNDDKKQTMNIKAYIFVAKQIPLSGYCASKNTEDGTCRSHR